MKRYNYSFPEDLAIEILSLVPVNSLMRFRCVCKSWFALTKDPSFVSKHVSNNVTDRRILVCGSRCHSPMKILSSQTLDVLCEDLGRRHFGNWPIDLKPLGSYKGIVSLWDEHRDGIVFLNPATREWKLVVGDPHRPRPEQVGFGYDFKTNDYKVIKILKYNPALSKYPVEVYALSTGSWRNSDAVIPNGFCFNHTQVICVNGIYSTMAYKPALAEEFLFTFDMSDEVFIVTPIGINLGERRAYLTELNNSVVLIDEFFHVRGRNRYVMSMLNEYGPYGTWKKLYSFKPSSDYITRPLGLRENDGLFLESPNGELIMCYIKTDELKKSKIGYKPMRLLQYEETLVSLNKTANKSSFREVIVCFLLKMTINFFKTYQKPLGLFVSHSSY